MISTNLRRLAAAALMACVVSAQAEANGARIVDDLLAAAQAGAACGSEATAIAATRARLAGIHMPEDGKFILVNIPNQILIAYEDGEPVFQMRVVVGSPRTKTPELQTELTFVQFNPTWTIPAGILRETGWQRKLNDPDYLKRNGFTVSNGEQGLRVVQSPGKDNALGLVKFGLKESGAIYLHDTNEPSKFGWERRTASHGCVRVEEPFRLAAWILGIEPEEARRRQQGGERTFNRDFGRIPVLLAYFTALPDDAGGIAYYPDVYGKDAAWLRKGGGQPMECLAPPAGAAAPEQD